MPTHSLLSFMESPNCLMQEVLISGSASVPGLGSSMTPHGARGEKAAPNHVISCMFCDQTFAHQDELGPHVLSQHPTTFPEPAVLRVEAEFRIPGERLRPKAPAPVEKDEVHSCIVCGHVSQYSHELENHMRKHKDYFYYCCSVCGRRFREPWFLKTHMKMHAKAGSKSRAAQEADTPVTINGAALDAPEPVATLYEMCMVCGFFFPDRDSLADHCKVHNREVEAHDKDAGGSDDGKEAFVCGLKLRPARGDTTSQPGRTSKWIAQLDPFSTYQAWQLATKGKIAVGPNNTKDAGQEASTDNEECASDKEEVAAHVPAEVAKEGRGGVPAVAALPQRRSLIQKDKSKERPTTCDECNKTFRTYHQLVLHSRIHKRESPTPTPDKPSRPGEQEYEDGLEEAPLADILASVEDCFERAKGRSKECTYCGKSFRSSYYLTVHLRTHTGEKPFKCAYCDYAAAQKTSLKYHLDRRHKDKPYLELSVRPASCSSSSSSLPSPSDLKLEPDSENSSSPTKLWIKEAKPLPHPAQLTGSFSVDSKPPKPLVHSEAEFAQLASKCGNDPPVPVNLKVEKQEIKDEIYDDAPLNLSLKVSLSISAEPTKAMVPSACPQCTFTTIYPEVLVIHQKLLHKEKSTNGRKPAASRQKRHTGCPPALDGKDVAPLPMIHRSHPRRTKSPPPLPSKPQEKATKATLAPKQSPLREQESPKVWQNVEPQDGKFTEVMKKQSTGSAKYLLEMPTDRIGIGDRSYPVRNGVVWPTDSSRLCLSSRFGNLPRIDLGEPSNKRLKYSGAPQMRESDGAEKATYRNISAAEMANLSLGCGRSSLPGPPLSSQSVQDALGAVKSSSVALGGALDSEWGTMNLLRSCTLNDLASLYHTSPGNPPRAGGRTVLYQHLPALPHLPHLEPAQRYGTADKSA